MELSEMTLAELFERLERTVDTGVYRWRFAETIALRAELKKRCEAAAAQHSHATFPDWHSGEQVPKSLLVCLHEHVARLASFCRNMPNAPQPLLPHEWEKCKRESEYWLKWLCEQTQKQEAPACPCPEYRGEKLHWAPCPVVGERTVRPDGCWNCLRFYGLAAKPCPCSGDKDVTLCGEWFSYNAEQPCVKCKEVGPIVGQNEHGICHKCLSSKPDASEGYEHVNEWDKPGDRYFLSHPDNRAVRGFVNDHIDGGKRWILREALAIDCPKCGRPMPNALPEKPCAQCWNEKLPAPAGYEFEGRWDKPRLSEPFLDKYGTVSFGTWADPSIDQGRRWILRKVESQKTICPKCKRVQQDTEAGEAIYWLDKPCPDCAPAPFVEVGVEPRMTRADRELPGKVAALTRRVEKLEQETP